LKVSSRVRWFAFVVTIATFVAGMIYWPSMKGPFVFDDLYLPFSHPDAAGSRLAGWLGVRPVLMLSYWLNYHFGGLDPAPYHAVNLVLHIFCACLVYTIVRRILELNDCAVTRQLALGVAGLFLLHPLHTEAVAYISGRSDTLSAVFAYCAFSLYIYSGRRMPRGRGAAIIILVALACSSKENCVVLPVIFLFTDLFWDRSRIIAHKGFYEALAVLSCLLAVVLTRRVLLGALTAGFHLPGLGPLEYFYTECRAIWVYLRLFFIPVNQNADYEFAVSHTILEHDAVIGFLATMVLVALAIRYRKSYRIEAYGLVLFLLLIAPTSSVLPILDPLAERRLYLPSIGLFLVMAGLASRVWGTKEYGRLLTLSIFVLIFPLFGFLTFRRSEVWSSPIALWKDTVAKSPRKYRPRFQLAYAEYQAGNCQEASSQYANAAQMGPRDHRLLVDWALAEDCAGQPEVAIAQLREAAELQPTAQAFAQSGLIRAKQGRYPEALELFHRAELTDPGFEMTYMYRGILYARSGNLTKAAADFKKALELNPRDQNAAGALRMIEGVQQATKQ
jgi:tetratricopeptide (TPR) repeat protein